MILGWLLLLEGLACKLSLVNCMAPIANDNNVTGLEAQLGIVDKHAKPEKSRKTDREIDCC